MWPHYRIGAMSARRPPIVGRYTAEEVELATRNHGMPLEALRYDVTPAGLHYLLVHFDIPPSDAGWSLGIGGLVEWPFSLSLAELRSEASLTIRATLECAGNGRGQISPRYPSVPWLEEGVSTAEWTGVAPPPPHGGAPRSGGVERSAMLGDAPHSPQAAAASLAQQPHDGRR